MLSLAERLLLSQEGLCLTNCLSVTKVDSVVAESESSTPLTAKPFPGHDHSIHLAHESQCFMFIGHRII